jgi:L-Ala-D/L-Glu epimerase
VIRSIDWHPYKIPMRNGFITAHGSLPVREGAIVKICVDSGIIGFGDVAPLEEFGCGTLADALKAFPELVACISAMSIDEALTFLWKHINAYPSSLVSGLELALLDAQGKARRCPLSQLLLEYSGRTDIYAARKCVSVNTVIGAATLDAAVEEARSAVLKGFGCVKLKVGAGQATIERVAAVRQAIGPAVHLRLDANEAWSFEQAKTILRACEAFDIQYVEQPLPKHDIAGMARLRSGVAIPIAADEAVSDLGSARLLMHTGAADILIVKPQFAHGLRMARQIIIEAGKQGIQCVLTSAMESGIGVAGVLHLAAALSEITLECGLATLPLLQHDLLIDSLSVDNGWMRVPAGAGLGVEPDMQMLERYR